MTPASTHTCAGCGKHVDDSQAVVAPDPTKKPTTENLHWHPRCWSEATVKAKGQKSDSQPKGP